MWLILLCKVKVFLCIVTMPRRGCSSLANLTSLIQFFLGITHILNKTLFNLQLFESVGCIYGDPDAGSGGGVTITSWLSSCVKSCAHSSKVWNDGLYHRPVNSQPFYGSNESDFKLIATFSFNFIALAQLYLRDAVYEMPCTSTAGSGSDRSRALSSYSEQNEFVLFVGRLD